MSGHKFMCAKQAAPELVFCLLAHEGVWHPDAWHDLLEDSNGFAQVMIHSEIPKYGLEFTKKHQISEILPTGWGTINSVKAILVLLRTALVKTGAKIFVITSGDALPLKDAFSFATDNDIFSLHKRRVSPYIKRMWKKTAFSGLKFYTEHAMDCIITRGSAVRLVDGLLPILDTFPDLQTINADEYLLGTYLFATDPTFTKRAIVSGKLMACLQYKTKGNHLRAFPFIRSMEQTVKKVYLLDDVNPEEQWMFKNVTTNQVRRALGWEHEEEEEDVDFLANTLQPYLLFRKINKPM